MSGFSLRKFLRRRLIPRIAQSSVNMDNLIDWSNTVAYCPPSIEQGIYLNVAGRDPAGVVQPGADYEVLREQIIFELKQLKIPGANQRLANVVQKREDARKAKDFAKADKLRDEIKTKGYLVEDTPTGARVKKS